MPVKHWRCHILHADGVNIYTYIVTYVIKFVELLYVDVNSIDENLWVSTCLSVETEEDELMITGAGESGDVCHSYLESELSYLTLERRGWVETIRSVSSTASPPSFLPFSFYSHSDIIKN